MVAVEGKLQHVVDLTLRDKLRQADLLLSAGVAAPEIDAFVDTRNDLAHDMKFDAARGKPSDQYLAVRYVVDRFLLGLLHYHGPFIDCRKMARAEFGVGDLKI
jgi:hypothetical protein